MKENPMEVFMREAPAAAEAFNGLIDAICSSSDGMDAKTRQLAYIAIKASQGDMAAVYAHVPMAKAEGASRGEVRDAILLTLTTAGIRGVVSCLGPAMEMYDTGL